MTEKIDLNADLGEYQTPEEQDCEQAVLRYVSSCNVACGGHAGNEETMRATLIAAKAANVAVGAHPSYPDREGFGRVSLDLPMPLLKRAIITQLLALKTVAEDVGVTIAHVKPHGALYNDAMGDSALSGMLLDCLTHVFPGAIMVGLPGSRLAEQAAVASIPFKAEAFIDRRYTDEGVLQPRSEDGAVLVSVEERVAQGLKLAREGKVITNSDAEYTVEPDTLCLHGDSPGAVETAKAMHAALVGAGFEITDHG